MNPSSPYFRAEAAPVAAIRNAILGILAFGVAGILAELLLLEHTEGRWQIFPVALLAAAAIVITWNIVDRQSAAGIRVLQGVMLAFVVCGAVGIVLHYNGNVEFELERNSDQSGLALFWEAIKGATPSLAPGAMVQLGLMGLAYSFRHPAVHTDQRETE